MKEFWTTVGIVLLLNGCAHEPFNRNVDPAVLYESVLKAGDGIESAEGNVWMKAESPQASGQFSAFVRSSREAGVKLEVLNLIGGTEALIRVDGNQYSVIVPGKKEQNRKGYGSWGGLPLVWARDLFLGKFPAPRETSQSKLSLSSSRPGHLRVARKLAQGTEVYEYEFREEDGQPWVDRLVWSLKVRNQLRRVEFEFRNPESETNAPLSWNAFSKRGTVKVRWKSREINS